MNSIYNLQFMKIILLNQTNYTVKCGWPEKKYISTKLIGSWSLVRNWLLPDKEYFCYLERCITALYKYLWFADITDLFILLIYCSHSFSDIGDPSGQFPLTKSQILLMILILLIVLTCWSTSTANDDSNLMLLLIYQ